MHTCPVCNDTLITYGSNHGFWCPTCSRVRVVGLTNSRPVLVNAISSDEHVEMVVSKKTSELKSALEIARLRIEAISQDAASLREDIVALEDQVKYWRERASYELRERTRLQKGWFGSLNGIVKDLRDLIRKT